MMKIRKFLLLKVVMGRQKFAYYLEPTYQASDAMIYYININCNSAVTLDNLYLCLDVVI